MKKMKKQETYRKGLLLLTALLFLLLHGFILNRLCRLGEYTGLISMSYPLGAVKEENLEKWKKGEDSRLFSDMVLWKNAGETMVLAESTGKKQKTDCWQMKGQPKAVFGKELTEGSYFTEGERDVCLLDQEAARQLFGSEHVIGMKVQADGQTRRIAGILKGNTSVCILPAKKGTDFDGLAVRKKNPKMSSNLAVSLLETVFGSTDGQKIDGRLYYMTAWLFYTIIFAFGCFLAGVLTGKGEKKRKRQSISVLYMVFAAGILILGMKMAAPGSDYLPTYWADFEFFTGLFQEKALQIQRLLVHQEFVSWYRMLQDWQQAITGIFLLGVLEMMEAACNSYCSRCLVPRCNKNFNLMHGKG